MNQMNQNLLTEQNNIIIRETLDWPEKMPILWIDQILQKAQEAGFIYRYAQNGNMFQICWPENPRAALEYDGPTVFSLLMQRLQKYRETTMEVKPKEIEPQTQVEIDRDNFIANATDAAVTLANENQVNLNDVQGTGKDGRIGVQDVRNHISFLEQENESEPDEETEGSD